MVEQIHYQVFFTDEQETLLRMNQLVSCGILNVYLKELPTVISEHFSKALQLQVQDGLKLMIDFSHELIAVINPSIVIINEEQNVRSKVKDEFPTVKIAAHGHSLVECKNWELAGVDFLIVDYHSFSANTLQPNALIGSEALQAFYPSKEEYGWVFLSINTPVFVKGMNFITEIEILLRDTDLRHFIINDQFEPSLNMEEKVKRISNLEYFS